jgi:hypothetical protein
MLVAGGSLEKKIALLTRKLNDALEQQTATSRELSEVLDHQTATTEVLRVISSSPTDVQHTFEAIAGSARSIILLAATSRVGISVAPFGARR